MIGGRHRHRAGHHLIADRIGTLQQLDRADRRSPLAEGPEGDDLHRGLRQRKAVALLVDGPEALDVVDLDLVALPGVPTRQHRGDLDGTVGFTIVNLGTVDLDTVGFTIVNLGTVGFGTVDLGTVGRTGIVLELGSNPVLQGAPRLGEPVVVVRCRPRPSQVVTLGSAHDANRRQHPSERRHDDRRHAQRSGQVTGMQRPGATEGDQGQTRRVDTAGHADAAQRALHVGRDHRQGPFGFDALPGKRLGGSPAVERAQRTVTLSGDAAQHHVGVGHRRLDATSSVGDRARLCAGRPGADRDRSAGVGRHDRPSPRPDGDHIQ